MADKYVDVSATFNGDGTASTPAASAGAVGAWNDFANAYTGTPAYGSLTNGDTVYIRTNDGSNDLSYTISAVTLTSVVGTVPNSPIRFIFDAGVVWANSGTFTVFLSNSLSAIIVVSNFVTLEGNFHMNHLYAGSSGGVGGNFIFRRCVLRGGKITNGVQTTDSRSCKLLVDSPGGLCTMVGTELVIGNAPINTIGNGSGFKFVDCVIDVSQGKTTYTIYELGRYGASIEMVGCRFVGLTPNHKLYAASTSLTSMGYTITLDGIDLGNVNPDTFIRNVNAYTPASTPNAALSQQQVLCNNVNGGFNYASFNGAVYESWVSGANYPTLNAVLPDNTPWSIRVAPAMVHRMFPAPISSISKLFVSTPATKTLTFELALHVNYGTPTKKDFYVEVAYFDSETGALISQTSEAESGNLSASTAVWSPNPPVYGADNYNRYKIEITTSHSIKQNSLIRATLISTLTPTFSTDYYFVDPEFLVS